MPSHVGSGSRPDIGQVRSDSARGTVSLFDPVPPNSVAEHCFRELRSQIRSQSPPPAPEGVPGSRPAAERRPSSPLPASAARPRRDGVQPIQMPLVSLHNQPMAAKAAVKALGSFAYSSLICAEVGSG